MIFVLQLLVFTFLFFYGWFWLAKVNKSLNERTERAIAENEMLYRWMMETKWPAQPETFEQWRKRNELR